MAGADRKIRCAPPPRIAQWCMADGSAWPSDSGHRSGGGGGARVRAGRLPESGIAPGGRVRCRTLRAL